MIADVTAPAVRLRDQQAARRGGLLHTARAKGSPTVVGRFHNVYGPRMGADHVIPEMALRAMRGEDPFLVRGADQYRAFCYVDDAVEAMLRLMSSPEAAGQIVHIGDDTRADQHRATLPSSCFERPGSAPRSSAAPAPPGSVARRCPDLTNAAATSPATSRRCRWRRGSGVPSTGTGSMVGLP